MPNQRAANIQVTTIAIDKGLIKQLDKFAKLADRSRNKVIEMILRNELPRYVKKLTAVNMSVELGDELAAQLDQIASTENCSRSYIVSKFLQEQVAVAKTAEGSPVSR